MTFGCLLSGTAPFAAPSGSMLCSRYAPTVISMAFGLNHFSVLFAVTVS
jgi:hypothetical protein